MVIFDAPTVGLSTYKSNGDQVPVQRVRLERRDGNGFLSYMLILML